MFTLANRLDRLSRVSEGIGYTFDCALRPFSAGEVMGPDGQIVADISPELQRAKARLMRAVTAFERTAALELAAADRVEAQSKADLASLKSLERADRLNFDRHERTAKEQAR